MQTALRYLFWIAALSAVAIWNGYPLLAPDSGNYLATAFSDRALVHQSPLYGLWIRFTGLGLSLWLPIFAQTLCLAFLLEKVADEEGWPTAGRWGFAALLAGTTPAGWYSGQAMADAWTAIAMLALGLLLLARQLRRPTLLVIQALLLLALLMHFSHWLAALLLLPFIARKVDSSRRRQIIAICFAPALLYPLVNWSLSGNAYTERASRSFLVGRLFELGLVAKVHATNCPSAELPFCQFSPKRLSGTINFFLWQADSPHHLIPAENKGRQYSHLLATAMRQYPIEVTVGAISGMVKQAFFFAVGDSLSQQPATSAIFSTLEERLPLAAKSARTSRVQREELQLQRWNLFYLCCLFGWLALGTVISPAAMRWRNYLWLAYFANAAVCGFWTGGFYRYAGRAVWLLPLTVILSLRKINFPTLAKLRRARLVSQLCHWQAR